MLVDDSFLFKFTMLILEFNPNSWFNLAKNKNPQAPQ